MALVDEDGRHGRGTSRCSQLLINPADTVLGRPGWARPSRSRSASTPHVDEVAERLIDARRHVGGGGRRRRPAGRPDPGRRRDRRPVARARPHPLPEAAPVRPVPAPSGDHDRETTGRRPGRCGPARVRGVLHLPGRRRPGPHRRQRRQRRRRRRHLRVGRGPSSATAPSSSWCWSPSATWSSRRWWPGWPPTPARAWPRSSASSSRCGCRPSPSLAFAVANVGLVVTEFAGIGTAFELFGVSRYLSVPIAAVAIWMLVIARLLPLRRAGLPAPHRWPSSPTRSP